MLIGIERKHAVRREKEDRSRVSKLGFLMQLDITNENEEEDADNMENP